MTLESVIFWCLVGTIVGGLVGHLRGAMGLGMGLGLFLGPLIGPIAVMLVTLNRDKPVVTDLGTSDQPRPRP